MFNKEKHLRKYPQDKQAVGLIDDILYEFAEKNANHSDGTARITMEFPQSEEMKEIIDRVSVLCYLYFPITVDDFDYDLHFSSKNKVTFRYSLAEHQISMYLKNKYWNIAKDLFAKDFLLGVLLMVLFIATIASIACVAVVIGLVIYDAFMWIVL